MAETLELGADPASAPLSIEDVTRVAREGAEVRIGAYEVLGRTYQRIYGGWLPQSRYHLRDVPAFEQYLNSPQNTKPEDLLTLIHVPLGA